MTSTTPAASSVPALLWGLSRPRGLPWVASLPLIGFAWAHWDRALVMQSGLGILWLMAAWASLQAGTMWLNAALDRDTGGVLFGRALPVPAVTVPAGAVALAVAVGLALAVHPVSGALAAGCALLAVLYSHPAVALKGHPIGGPAVNALGYGVLAPTAGWWLAGVTPTARTWVSLVLLVAWMLGCTFVAQVWQRDDDAARAYRTLVVTAGPDTTRRVGRALLGGTVAVLTAFTVVGWYPRALLVALPAYVWADAVIARRSGWDAAWGGELFRRLLVFAWLLVASVTAEYIRESLAGEPVAGLGTAAGHPPDRPLLPPAQLRRWEATAGRR